MEGNFDLFEIVRLGSLGFTLHYFLFVLNLLKALKVFFYILVMKRISIQHPIWLVPLEMLD